MSDADQMEASGRKPSPLIAFILGFLAPGLGHFYAGDPWKGAAGLLVFSIVLVPLASQIRLMLSIQPLGVAAGSIISLGILMLVATDGALRARVKRKFTLSRFDRWYAYVAWFVVAVLITTLAWTIILPLLPYRLFHIPTGSMIPTLLIGDRMVGRMHVFDAEDMRRGQVVIYEPPDLPGVLYTHRLVGLPGEIVEIRDKQVFINGKALDEPYKLHLTELDPVAYDFVREGGRIGPAEREAMKKRAWKPPFPIGPELFNWGPVLVPEGTVLLLGDNRDNSKDGRARGPVAVENLRGRALRIYWSSSPESPLDIRWKRTGMRIE